MPRLGRKEGGKEGASVDLSRDFPFCQCDGMADPQACDLEFFPSVLAHSRHFTSSTTGLVLSPPPLRSLFSRWTDVTLLPNHGLIHTAIIVYLYLSSSLVVPSESLLFCVFERVTGGLIFCCYVHNNAFLNCVPGSLDCRQPGSCISCLEERYGG